MTFDPRKTLPTDSSDGAISCHGIANPMAMQIDCIGHRHGCVLSNGIPTRPPVFLQTTSSKTGTS
jgi:hypothetical protein